VICGLICAADIVRANGATELALFLEEHADWIEAHLEDWTVTNNGKLLPGVPRHYMRIRPPQCGDPYAHEGCDRRNVRINNRGPGRENRLRSAQRGRWGFLELVRYGVRRADDPVIVDSLKVIDHVLKVETPVGPCWRRYNHDGYGQRHDGGPFLGWGQGRAWPLLTGERAHYELAAGHDVKPYIQALEGFSSQGGMLPEQIWDAPDIPEMGLEAGQIYRSGHAPGVGTRGVCQTAAIGDRRQGIRPHLRRRRALRPRQTAAPIEVFRLNRQLQSMVAGRKLRVLADDHFSWCGRWMTGRHVRERRAAPWVVPAISPIWRPSRAKPAR
jgi:glucoamylase